METSFSSLSYFSIPFLELLGITFQIEDLLLNLCLKSALKILGKKARDREEALAFGNSSRKLMSSWLGGIRERFLLG